MVFVRFTIWSNNALLFSACMMFDLAGDSVYQGQPSSDPVIDVGGTEPEEPPEGGNTDWNV